MDFLVNIVEIANAAIKRSDEARDCKKASCNRIYMQQCVTFFDVSQACISTTLLNSLTIRISLYVCDINVLNWPEARRRCEFFMSVYHVEWPDGLDCDLLPESSDPDICVGQLQFLQHVNQTKRTSAIFTRRHYLIPFYVYHFHKAFAQLVNES